MKTIHFSDVPKQAYNAAIIETIFTTNDKTELHGHDFCELFFVKHGEITHFINSQSFVLHPYDFWLIRQSDVHCFQKRSSEKASLVNISFPTDFYDNLFQSAYLDNTGKVLSHKGTLNHAQMTFLEELLALLLKAELSSEEKLCHKKSLLASLLQTILLTQTIWDSQTAETPAWLSHAIDSLQKPEILQQGIEGLVRLCGRSQEHITRQLRKYYGKTPSQIINKLRIDQAKKLLSTTCLPILDISIIVGYDSVSYFNRLFMQQTGMTPRSYRNILQNFI